MPRSHRHQRCLCGQTTLWRDYPCGGAALPPRLSAWWRRAYHAIQVEFGRFNVALDKLTSEIAARDSRFSCSVS
ncbi:hypothetical protein NP493_1155g00022 [Ridgeia piscesae]|uniref:Uncharacterized protein n=1 Tax=Ridgeia piscesae TaxID=27915 RepID=A0AAD9NK97_RIDPI|nr:hypothetical protein NP493_1155g00022 [Ridgeia piscesae]